MNINELYKEIQNKFQSGDLNGELSLHGNCIHWEYNLDDDCEEIYEPNMDDDENYFSFESSSVEELLQEAYVSDKEQIEGFFDEIDEIDNWSFAESEIRNSTIFFKIF
jgi:hypothetical protein